MPKLIYKALALFSVLVGVAAAQADVLPLPAEKAFVFSVYFERPTELMVEWQIAPGYYLYRDKLRINTVPTHPGRLGAIEWPAPKTKLDPVRGTFRAYDGLTQVGIPLKGPAHQELTLSIQYQGCSQDGFCYAPMKKVVHVAYPFNTEGLQNAPLLMVSDAVSPEKEKPMVEEAVLEKTLLTDQDATKAFLSGHAFIVTLLCFLGLGVLLAFTPCSLPMLPILSSLIVGRQNLTTRRAFNLALSYVLGLSLTYAAAGLVIAWLGSGVQAYFQNPWIISAFSLLFVALAFSMLGFFDLRLPAAWQQRLMSLQQEPRGGTYLGVFLMGAFSTLIVSPCVTAPLVGVLAYISETGNLVLGGTALFALGLGMGLPLLLLGLSAGKYLPKAGPWMEVIKRLFAFMLLGMAIWMLARILPGGVTLFLWACLLFGLAIFLLFMEGLSRFWRYAGYFSGALCLVYGFVLFVGVAMNHSSPFYPFESLALAQSAVIAEPGAAKDLDFTVVTSMEQLNASLEKARQEHKPVMLDYYAAWCESCQALEKAVLGRAAVQDALRRFVLLRANVTENNAFDQALLKRYHVVAPPTFVFFNGDGEEVKGKRIVGEVDHQLFLASVSAI